MLLTRKPYFLPAICKLLHFDVRTIEIRHTFSNNILQIENYPHIKIGVEMIKNFFLISASKLMWLSREHCYYASAMPCTGSSRRILKNRYGPILFLIPVMVRFNNWDRLYSHRLRMLYICGNPKGKSFD